MRGFGEPRCRENKLDQRKPAGREGGRRGMAAAKRDGNLGKTETWKRSDRNLCSQIMLYSLHPLAPLNLQ